ncbi:MAG: hypothetical protein KBF12_06075 [Sebaldella sp.]|nr:hypothetical protein [Sebaldella sp.]
MRRSLDYLLEKKQEDFYNSLNNINTTSLAKVIEVDNTTLEASIELIAKTEFKDNFFENPVINAVPIMPVFNSSSFYINAPYNIGDLVVVGFCQHSLEGTIDSTDQIEPHSKDKYSLDDAIILGNITAQYTDQFPEDLSIIHKESGNYLRFTKDGSIEIQANTKIIGNLEVSGTGTFNGLLESADDVQSNSISLINHKHGNVQSGGSDTGVPK